MALYSKGSEWHKWDLHIHSPASGLNNQFPHDSSGAPDWEAYIRKLESLTDIVAVGITDYFTIEGYRKVREFHEAGRLRNIALILPNIEFRLDRIIETATGTRRLNYHVIFSDDVTPDQIDEHFLQELKFVFEGDPQNTDLSWSIRKANLQLLGDRLKKEHAQFDDGRSDFEIGCMNATVDPTLIKRVLEDKSRIFGGKYLIVLAEESLSLLEWNDQAHHTRKLLLQGADCIFSSNRRTIDWACGKDDLSPEQFRKEFKTLKPCLHGSDGHCLDVIGRPDQNRFCWVKGEATFEGLKQVLYEPSDRIWVGEEVPKLKNDYQVLGSFRVTGAPSWFDESPIPLNEGLIAVIGPRGSGKSALAEMLAFAGGASFFRQPKPEELQDSFLSKASKKSPANAQPITDAKLEIRWEDTTTDEVIIPASLQHGRDEEKVKYLPQRFVEQLCAPEHTVQLEQEIEGVIFERIDKTQRLECSNFQELRRAATRSIQIKRERLRQTLQILDQSIAQTQLKIGTKSAKQTEVDRRRKELQALVRQEPKVPEQNKGELAELDRLMRQRQELEARILYITEQRSAVDAIETRFELMREDLGRFNEEIGRLLDIVDLGGEKHSFLVEVPREVPLILSRKRNELTKTIDGLRLERPAGGAPSLDSVSKEVDEINKRLKLTEAKRREYEKFQKDKKHLEGMIASLEKEIREIDAILSPRLKEENDTRMERYLDCFDLLKEERGILETLYQPLRTALLSSNETAKKLAFVSRVTLDAGRRASRGMELLDRRKSVYGDEAELEVALQLFFEKMEEADFSRDENKRIIGSFRETFSKIVDGRKFRIDDQLRKDWTAKDFADWFFDIEDYSVSYSIKFDGKDLHLLSPGEKGIVLLLLYLEAENTDNRPLIIDQPDDNLDNISVYPSLVEYFRGRKKTRQIIIITHNPNLVVNTDAEQIFVAHFDGSQSPKISYKSGAIEDSNPDSSSPGIRQEVCSILEGGTEAFQRREQKYAID